MPTTLSFKDLIDLPEWRSLASAPWVAGAGVSLACDLRNSEDRHPEVFLLASAVGLGKYSVKNDDWMPLATPALTGTFGAGADDVFVPHAGPAGSVGAGATVSALPITIPVFTGQASSPSLGANQLANRGDGIGFKVRVIGKVSGKTEERYVVGNTGGTGGGGGTVITLYLGVPLSFVPASGDQYELLSGRVYLLSAGLLAAGCWKFYDVATNAYSGNLATTNLPATIATDSDLLALSELHVPHDRAPGEGFFGLLTATATGVSTLTGHAVGGDAGLLVNEYRNFQIRVVEDAVTATAVGQRRRISSHTAGPSPVYTLASAWAPQPSANAKYVLENWSDCILLWSSAVVTTWNYSLAGNVWDTVTWAARPVACGAGVSAFQAFSLRPDAQKSCRHSYIFSWRGAATTALDLFDLAAAAVGAWTGAIIYGNLGITLTTGTGTVNEPVGNSGRYVWVSINGTQRFARFDMQNRQLEPYGWLEYAQGTVAAGTGVAWTLFVDGTTKVPFILTQRRGAIELFSLLVQR